MRTVVDTESYSRAMAGVQIDAVRIGRGTGPNTITAIWDQRFTANRSRVRFPIMTRSIINHGQMAFARIDAAVPGSRWCGIDLEPGMLFVYPPGAEHTAVNLAGVQITFAVTPLPELAARADGLRVRIEPPSPGRARVAAPSPRTVAVGSAFAALVDAAERRSTALHRRADDVLDALTLLLTEADPVKRVAAGWGLDSRHIVHQCIDYATAVERIPSLSELCLAAHVSERRLRQAFRDEFDLPPKRFFRHWGLVQAHRRLAHDAEDTTVSRVASMLGFGNLGRFAKQYRQLYGETPSATLKASRSTTAVHGGGTRRSAEPRSPASL